MKEFVMKEAEEIETFGDVWKRYEPVAELVRCRDCRHYFRGHCQCDDTTYWCREPDWYCADGEKQ